MFYFAYEPIYIKGGDQSEENDCLLAYNTLMKIIEEAQIKDEKRHYSFWQSASEIFIETAIEQYNDSLLRSLAKAHSGIMGSFSEGDLKR